MLEDKAAIDSRQIIADLQRELTECKAERDEAIARQAASTQVLETIRSSRGDLGPVFEAMLDNALHLCEASFGFVTIYDGERYASAAQRGVPDALAEYFKAGIDQPRPGDAHWRLIAGENLIHNLDQMDEEAYRQGNPLRRAVVDLGGARSALVVALRKEGVLFGALTIYRKEVRLFSDKQVALLQHFATQAVIAIENARLFSELHESLHQQTATADVLKAISQSAFDLDRIFEVVGENALRLCGADKAFIFRFDGEVMQSVFAKNASPELLDFIARNPIRPGRHTATARAALLRQTVYIEDVSIDPEFTYGARDVDPLRTTLSVPILKGDELLGVITIYRLEVKPFTEHQIALVETFADQAAIAIEQVRLLTELREALQQQTAMADVLRAISRSTFDLPSVLSTLVEAAVQLCEADQGTIAREQDGVFVRVASHGFSTEFMAAVLDKPVALDRGSASGRALFERRVIHIPDVALDPDYGFVEALQHGGFKTLIGVPMLRDGAPIGVLAMSRRETRPFTEKEIELVSSFADQAAIAIENARLFEEVQARNHELREALEQQTATSEILREISRSPTDLQPVFDMIAQSAARLCEAQFCFVADYDGTLIHFAAQHGLPTEAVEELHRVYPMPPGKASAVARVIQSGAVAHIPDVLADTDYRLDNVARTTTFRSIVGVPILKDGRPIGAIAVGRALTGRFPERQIKLLETFADQAVIAIENVRLFTEVQARNRELKEALEQQTTTAEVLKVISRSAFDLQNVLDTLVQSAARLCEAEMVSVTRQKADSNFHYHAASHGFSPEWSDYMKTFPLEADRGTLIGRTLAEGRTVHIPDVLADAEYTATQAQRLGGFRTVLGVPLLREGSIIGVFLIARRVIKPFTEKQIELVTTFADQAVIAIENVRLFDEVKARNSELNEALEQQTATSEILRVISSSPTDIQPVFDTIAESAARLCKAQFCFVFRYDGELIHFVSSHGVSREGIDSVLGQFPAAPGRGSTTSRAVLSGRVEQIPDVHLDPDYKLGNTADVAHYRSAAAVPMIRDGRVVGAITVALSRTGLLPERQVELLKAFAEQAVIAVENVRLFTELEARNRELDEALQQQTATADVLKVISRSTFDLQAVLDTLVGSAVRLCDAYDAVILLKERDWLKVGAHHGPISIDFAKWEVNRGWTAGRAVEDRQLVHVHDLHSAGDEFPEGHSMALRMGHRTILSVPLLREDEAIGVLTIRRTEVRPFKDKQIELVTTFADQAVIAIENVRLFEEVHARTRELTAALEQQTATSEILGAISTSPSSVQPVFETIVRNALPLCGSLFANVFRFDGELLHYVASHNIGPDFMDLLQDKYPMRPDSSQVAGRVILTKSIVRLENALEDPDYDQTFPLAMGWRRLLGVPMLREGEPLGVIVVGWAEAGAVPQRQEDLLKTFADQAVIAIENVRLFEEVQSRTRELAQSVEELRALGEVSQAVNSTLDLETVLNTIVAKAVQLSGTDAGAIYVLNKAHTKFKLRATYGMEEATVAAIRHSSIRSGETAISQATAQRHPIQIADVLAAPAASILDVVVQAGYRSILIVPLLGLERAIGVLVIRRKVPGAFPDSAIDLLQTFAAQSVLAIQNARLFHEIEEKSRELELASRHKSQFLANMSHELRTPLNAILGYSELILDDIYGPVPEKARAALARVQSNGKHLLGLINDVLDLAKIEAGRLTLALADYSLDEVVASVVAAVEALAAEKHLALTVEVPSDLPIGHGDEQRIRQVLLNLVSNAIKFTDAGEVTISARVHDGIFQVAVSDTGPGISAEDQVKLFQEFQQADSSSTRTKGGTGLGLAISKRFIDLHGGNIRVESAPGQGSTFTFELPVTVEPQEDAE